MAKVTFNFDKLKRETFRRVGFLLVFQARRNMQERSYGRVYLRKGGKSHTASKWGDSPNNDTLALTRSIRYETIGNTLLFGAGDAVVNYAKYLESKKILNRPNLAKSVDQQEKHITAEVELLFKKAAGFKK